MRPPEFTGGNGPFASRDKPRDYLRDCEGCGGRALERGTQAASSTTVRHNFKYVKDLATCEPSLGYAQHRSARSTAAQPATR